MSIIEDVLGPGGALSRVRSGYEHRAQQIEMAEAVGHTFTRGGVLFVEAGTGTGKTLAYLLAAVVADRRTIVSTGTRNLQDQLLNDDIPLLELALDRSLSVVCLKGLSNYLCRRRFDTLRRTALLLPPAEADLSTRIEEWALVTKTGDRAELTNLPEGAPLWNEICATPETRLGPRCPFHDSCFVTKARRAAQEAQIVVTNHHLFFADLALKNRSAALLPDYDAVVFDEAHQIDAVATTFFGSRVSSRQIEDLLNHTRRSVESAIAAGTLHVRAMSELESLFEQLTTSSSAFFSALKGLADGPGRAELRPEDLSGEPESAYFRLDSALEALAAHLGGLPVAYDEELFACGRRAENLRADLSEVLGPQRPTAVHWMESGARSFAVGASPIDVSAVLRESLFFQVDTAVLTSATLTVNGKFTFLRERLGIDFETAELVLPSPFDYRRQAALYLPQDAPDPRRPGYVEKLARLIVESSHIVEGGTLALFTNNRDMQRVGQLVRENFNGRVRVQGDAPKHALLEELRTTESPLLLLATSSFWEGVDVPGDALQLVIIARLPFASPADPVINARLRQIEAEGRSPFMDYQVPQASLVLQQGFGRLIRSRRDHGVVALLDRRAWTMGYGKVLLRSLPECTICRDATELRKWWDLWILAENQ